MRLTVDQIFGVLQCPLQHHLTESQVARRPAQVDESKRRKAIRESILYYHRETATNGTPPPAEQVVAYFNRLWYGDIAREEILTSRTLQKKLPSGNEATRWICSYIAKQAKINAMTIDIDRPFEVAFGEHVIVGSIDLVQEVETPRGPEIALVSFTSARSKPSPFYVRTHLGLTIQSYAFRSIYEAKEDRLSLWWLKNAERLDTHRTPKDYKKIAHQVEQAAWWITQTPTPRYGVHCHGCPFQEQCLEWAP